MQTKETMMRVKPFAITLDVGTSLANRTGSWRTLKPVYVDRLPPCNAKCPAGEQCQAWLFHAQSGNYENAWKQIIEDNPFPAVMGVFAITPVKVRVIVMESMNPSALMRLSDSWETTPSKKIGNCRFLQQIPASAF